jgi:hypothetical protein
VSAVAAEGAASERSTTVERHAGKLARMAPMIVRLLVAAAVVWAAWDGGSYSLASRQSIAVVVWWMVGLGVLLGFLRLGRPPRAVLLPVGLFLAFGAWTFASIWWSASAERPFLEVDRVLLYLGVLLLAALLARAGRGLEVAEGLALGVVAVGAVALASRCFPGWFPKRPLPQLLPGSQRRLSFPVDYWNGLASLLAVGMPLLLAIASSEHRRLVRALALAPVPLLVVDIYLASSRGAAAAAIAGALVLIALSPRRSVAVVASLIASVGAAAAISVVAAEPDLVAGMARGHDGLLTVLLVAATGAATAAAGWLVQPKARLGRRRARSTLVVAWALAVAAVAVAVALADPVQRFETFKEPPPRRASATFGPQHLFSAGGSGRWQFWSAAVGEFLHRPVGGGGAGSFEAWWAEHGTLAYFVRDAHSLYIETLGELGILGALLLVGALGTTLVLGARRARGDPLGAGLAAALVAYLVAAGVDWMWELAVVSLVGLGCAGLLLGFGAGSLRSTRWPVRAVAALVVACVCAAEALPLLVGAEVTASQAAVRAGRLDDARTAALRAVKVEPWAASPYVQLALVDEVAGRLATAREEIRAAIARDHADWRLWVVSARLATKAGDVGAARAALAQARRLNPRSPVLR